MAGLLDTLPPPGKASALDDLPPPAASGNPRTYKKQSLTGSEDPKRSTTAQVADLIEGTGKYSSGALIPAAIMSPWSTVAGVAGGYAAGKGAKAIASKAGADEDQARLAEDAGNIVGGGIGAKFGPRVLKAAGDTITLPKWVQSFRDNFAKYGPPAKPVTPVQRTPGWKNLPEPETGAPAPVDPIPASQTPSGRKPGSLATQQEQERLEPVAGNKPLPLWHSVRDRFVGPPTPVDPIPANQTPSGRKPGSLATQQEQERLEPVAGNKPLPLWHSVRDRFVGPPTPVDPIPANQTPSGRKPGGMDNQAPLPVPRVVQRGQPGWMSGPDSQVSAPSPVDPIPATQTPSGRKPGGIARMVPATAKPVTLKPSVSAKVSGATQTAADLMQTVGITPEAAARATPEQWKMIEQHAGGPVDRQAAISYLKAGVADAAANRAARGLPPAETVPVMPDQGRAPIRVRRR